MCHNQLSVRDTLDTSQAICHDQPSICTRYSDTHADRQQQDTEIKHPAAESLNNPSSSYFIIIVSG